MMHPELQQLLLIQEMCLEGELRCEQRAADARAARDWAQAAFEMQLKERYGRLKSSLWLGFRDGTIHFPG